MKIDKRFLLKAGVVVALIALLATTAYAFSLIMYRIKENYFQTGYVKVDIAFVDSNKPGWVNFGDEAIKNIKFEPGMRLCGDFVVSNLSEGDDKEDVDGIWYRIYFTDVTGGKLAKVVEATIYDGDTVLCSSTVAKLKSRTLMEPQALAHKESKLLTLELHFPEESGNTYQGKNGGEMTYSLSVVATQRRNNPEKDFGKETEVSNGS